MHVLWNMWAPVLLLAQSALKPAVVGVVVFKFGDVVEKFEPSLANLIALRCRYRQACLLLQFAEDSKGEGRWCH